MYSLSAAEIEQHITKIYLLTVYIGRRFIELAKKASDISIMLSFYFYLIISFS